MVNRVGSPLWPMSMQAMIGPIPKTSVNVVRDAVTAAVIRALDTRIMVSRRSISSTSSTAWRCRSVAATSSGSMLESMLRAWLTTTSLVIPPGTNSPTRACRRQHNLLRQRARSL